MGTRRVRAAAAFSLVASTQLSAAPPARPPEARLAVAWGSFEAGYHEALERHGIVGGSIALVHRGRMVASAVHGLRDEKAGLPVEEGTIYHWASITKTLTGIAILQLRDRGRLRLEDPAVKYLPELRQLHDPFGDVSEVSLRHLLTHSAGLRGSTWPWGGDKGWHPFEPPSYAQLAAMLPYTEIEFRPGSRYRYSNLGLVLLGRIVELLSGEDYEVYVDKNLLRPLEMHRSYFDRAPYHLLPQRSHSYYRDDAGLREAPFDFDTGVTVSNGGLNAPVPDMASYLAFLLGEGGPQERYDGVLSRASLREMFEPVLPIGGDDPGQEGMGLVFFLERREGRRLIGHSGGQGGFISHLYLDPAARAGYVVAFNTHATSASRGKAQDTRALDAELRDRLLRSVWPALTGVAPTPAGRD